MAEYPNNEATQIAEDAFWAFDFEKEEIPGKEYIESLNTVTTFYDYTFEYAQKNGCCTDKEDIDALAKFIFNKSKETGAEISSLTTIKNWLKKAPPTNNQAGRENVYKLCFALGMNAKETKEFFLKAYLERPFNYKNICEATYFFCLNKGFTYSNAERIIKKIEAEPSVKNEDAETITERIGYDISLIATEEDFIKYIVNNRSGFEVQNQTATAKIKELVEECKTIAKEQVLSPGEKISVDNIDELLNVITGYNARATENGEKEYKKSISKSKLPNKIRQNFPQREQFKNIEDGKASFDVIRKFLIILKFYHFFAYAKLHNAKNLEQGLYDEFVDETNEMLAECGYVQLYWRNPYDWLYGYCACAHEPLDELQDIIHKFYISDPNIHEDKK